MNPPVMVRQYRVAGLVQGVGFRPAVYRLANALGLAGWVCNDGAGARVEAVAAPDVLDFFEHRLREMPTPARVDSVEKLSEAAWEGAPPPAFVIRESPLEGARTTPILPDLATCPDCLRELLNPADRRHRYPFINCTHCGPRYSIVEALPYDRARTTMRGFTMCAECRAEYNAPASRRFHAQPNACPRCGPRLRLSNMTGDTLATDEAALCAAAAALRAGQTLAVKSLGGYHLMTDARDAAAVARLRRRKNRPDKPFAVMFPTWAALCAVCDVTAEEKSLLVSPAAPIVLVRRRAMDDFPGVAPDNPWLGAFLPYTPLHHLLLRDVSFPVVATSGNISNEPICYTEEQAQTRLRDVADLLLTHNRPIARPMDDSVVRWAAGRPLRLRLGRGYAPCVIPLPAAAGEPVVAVGGHLKNTVALAVGGQAVVSQHLGDLDTVETQTVFENTLADLRTLYAVAPTTQVCDAHPDYISSRYALRQGAHTQRVQHHQAHLAACLLEQEVNPAAPVLGVIWDGTGYGDDGSVWGGEFLRLDADGVCRRVGHLRGFRLAGGDRAVMEPRRAALGVLWELFGRAALDMDFVPAIRALAPAARATLAAMLEKNINAPITSSAGRLFDAAAALAGGVQRATFEGQAAMQFEYAQENGEPAAVYGFDIRETEDEGRRVIDWGPLVRELLADVRAGVGLGRIAARFHNTMATTIVTMARHAKCPRVALAGGCFQNRILLEKTVSGLRAAGMEPLWPRELPPHDEALAPGQLAAFRMWAGRR